MVNMGGSIQATFAVSTIVSALFIILLAVIGFLLKTGIDRLITACDKLEDTCARLFARFDDHETRLSHLEGEHKARTGAKLSCTEVR
jgi:O-methyltransferase involved in polyketide biosynthesis